MDTSGFWDGLRVLIVYEREVILLIDCGVSLLLIISRGSESEGLIGMLYDMCSSCGSCFIVH